jgi:DNA-binding NarL/FixJ family response regulator
MKSQGQRNAEVAGRTFISLSESLNIKHQINKILMSRFSGTRYALVMESRLTAMLLKHQLNAVVCVGIYRGRAEAELGMQREPPEVLLVSSQLVDGTAAEVLRELRIHQPLARSLVFVSDSELHGDYQGFNGVVAERDLGSFGRPGIRAMHAALNNTRYCSPTVVKAQAEQRQQERKEGLTEREQEILVLLQKGMSNQAIAAELGLTLETVKTYCKTVLAKLGAGNRHELLRRERGTQKRVVD